MPTPVGREEAVVSLSAPTIVGPRGCPDPSLLQPDELLTAAAAAGDPAAWAELVEQYAAVVWQATRDAGLPAEVGRVVCQLAWLRVGEVLENHPHLGAQIEQVLLQTVERETRAHAAGAGRRFGGIPVPRSAMRAH